MLRPLRRALQRLASALDTAPETPVRPSYPRAPHGLTIYAVGDLHGRDDLLAVAHAAIDRDHARGGGEAVELCLGDYVDRGPASAQVIERLIRRGGVRRLVCLRGNHEDLFEDYLAGALSFAEWRALGGAETLMSYGVDLRGRLDADREEPLRGEALARVPDAHRAFLSGLPRWFDLDPYLFVHAGVRPGVAIERQTAHDMTWIREEFLLSDVDHGRIVVHGHTPTPAVDFRRNRINIDTGAYATGRLCCLRIGQDGVHELGIG